MLAKLSEKSVLKTILDSVRFLYRLFNYTYINLSFYFFIAKDYGLFLPDEENKTGVWLEPARHLEYYILRNGDLLEYRKKLRTLRVKMLDGKYLDFT